MMRKVSFLLGVGSIFLLTGCRHVTTTEDTPPISNEATTAMNVTLNEAIASYETFYPDTTITSIQLDATFGRYYYEITGVDDRKEYEVDIDAESGEAKKDKEETLDRDEQHGIEAQEHGIDFNNLKTFDEVTELARTAFGEGKVVKWQLEKDHGVTYWEIELKEGKHEMSVTLDGKTGEILEQEMDD
jgi:Predicted membrane protein